MSNRVEMFEDDLVKVSGGAMDLSYVRGDEYGTISSSVTGQTYTFKAEYLVPVATIMSAKGIDELDKINQMMQYFE